MEQFYFQLATGLFGFMITGFVGWMAFNTQRMTNKVAAFDERFKGVGEDLSTMSVDIRELRKYDAIIATHAIQIGGVDRRVTELEHTKRKARG